MFSNRLIVALIKLESIIPISKREMFERINMEHISIIVPSMKAPINALSNIPDSVLKK